MTAFFAWHKKHENIIFSRSKSRNKNPRHDFVDFALFFNIAVEIFAKNILVKLEPSKEIFLSPECPISGPNFRNLVN